MSQAPISDAPRPAVAGTAAPAAGAGTRPGAARSGPRRSGRSRAGRTGRLGYLVYLIPSAVLFLCVIVVPFVMNIGISFTHWQGVGTPDWAGFDNYTTLFHDSDFWASFRHNLALIVAMAILPTIFGLLLAAALVDFVGKQFRPAWASVLRAGFYLPQVMPIAVAGIVWYWILSADGGALNSVLSSIGLGSLQHDWLGNPTTAMPSVMGVMLWVQLGYPVVIFMAGLSRVDPSLYEAAELDGASWWQRFLRITIHLIRPEIYVVLLTCTIAALKAFGPIYVLTRGGPGGATSLPSYYSYQNFFEKANVGYGATISTILTVIIVGLTVLFLRVQSNDENEDA